MIYCPGCGTANRDGSRFCNECGTKLPTMTSSLCPVCGTPNPPHSLFCEKCGARLIASLADEPEESEAASPTAYVPKGLSLPTKSAEGASPPQPSSAPAGSEEAPDWMDALRASADTSPAATSSAQPISSEAAADEVPDWLSGLGITEEQPAAAKKPQTDELLPDWARQLRTMPEAAKPAEGDEVPDWLQALGTTGQLSASGSAEAAPAAPTAEEKLDWLTGLGTSATEAPSESEELPDWMKDPGAEPAAVEPLASIPEAAPPALPQEEMPDWLRDLRPVAATDDALPDWLDELGVEETGGTPSTSTALSSGDTALDWLSQLSATAPETVPESTAPTEEAPAWLSGLSEEQPSEPAEEITPPPELKPVTDWLSALRGATPAMEAEQAEEEMPEWLRESSAEQEVPDWMREQPSVSTKPAPSEAQQPPAEEEGVPDWMKGFGAVAAGAAALGALEEEPAKEVAPPPEQKPPTDWLSALRGATPEPEATSAEEEGVPDWMKGFGAVAAGAEEERPPVAEEKPVTDWLSALRGATPAMEAEQAEEEVPEWLREPGTTPEAIGEPQSYEQEVPTWLREEPTTEQPPAEEEGVPDWMKGLGAVAAGAAALGAMEEEPAKEVAPPPEQKPPTDWLSALRRAAPEMEAEQAGEEEQQPEWLTESGAAPEAVGGPQPYAQEIPDWLRESVSAVEAEEAQPTTPTEGEGAGLPDWLKGAGVVAAGAAAVSAVTPQAEPEPGAGEVPDWLREMSQPTPTPAVTEEPEWLREEQPPTTGTGELPDWLREAEPVPAASVEPLPEEEAREEPEWLRGLAPTAAAGAAVAVSAETEEEAAPSIEEAEEPGWLSEMKPAVAAGAAAAAITRAARKEEPAAAPAEMPDWLKELRQEQEAAKGAIPVPPPEAAGLTQAEIPAWVEALRPTEEAALAPVAEAPAETEGPLAGIANVLPSAAMLGEVQGTPAPLRFEVSAEDQARAGVLRELLGQAVIAPVRVEQFIVKSLPIRRRAVRWVVAAVLITAMLLPGAQWAVEILSGTQLLPEMNEMLIPPTVKAAVIQMSQLPAGAKALVVFDYDAAQAGELNQVASALLGYLALRGVPIQAVSLNPQGPAAAQAIWAGITNTVPSQFSVLPFTPGQANGAQALLAHSEDVQLVIDLAASPDTVRWWVEQMAASQVKTPLIVGVSAGAETLTMPYLQSGQVKGMVSGVPGAIAFRRLTPLLGSSSDSDRSQYQTTLDSLVMANYVLAVLIVVGLIAALFRGTGRRSSK